MGLKYCYHGCSDKGLVRDSNEDAWGALGNLFLLADGIGGRNAGEIAAREAVDHLAYHFGRSAKEGGVSQDLLAVQQALRRAIQQTNRFVYQLAFQDPLLYGMGTTLCCLMFMEDFFVRAHLGDSRIYRLREGELEQLTEDHSLASEMVARGELKAADVATFNQRHVITRSVGIEWHVEPTIDVGQIAKGDRYLLCSDGLSDSVPHEEIRDILIRNPPVKEAVHCLVEAAKAAGGRDNITAVVVNIEDVHE